MVLNYYSKVAFIIVATTILWFIKHNPLALLCDWANDLTFWGQDILPMSLEDFIWKMNANYIHLEDDLTRDIRNSLRVEQPNG